VYLYTAGDSSNVNNYNTTRIGENQTRYSLEEELPNFPAESGILTEASASNPK